ncbi:MAG: hypothetical protein ABIJ56_04745 [Pseudomonadota bacterium]
MMKEDKMEKLTVEIPPESICIKEASCPNGHAVMDPDYPMGDAPSIKLILVSSTGVESTVHVNPWYGNFEVDSRPSLVDGEVYSVHCPGCMTLLKSKEHETCTFCGAMTFGLALPKGGVVEACSRKGCHNHRLKIVDISSQLANIFDLDTKPRF